MQELKEIFLNHTFLPTDIINLIIDFTICKCEKEEGLMRINHRKCKFCRHINVSSTYCYLHRCSFCRRDMIRKHKIISPQHYALNTRKKIKSCIICHNCLIKKDRVRTCMECKDIIIKF